MATPIETSVPFYGGARAKLYYFAVFCFAIVAYAYLYGGVQFYPYLFLLALLGAASAIIGYAWGHSSILTHRRVRTSTG